MLKKFAIFLTLLFTLSFFILGLLTLPDYGINWDTINHLTRGQAYLNFFLTGKTDFSNLPQKVLYWQNPRSLFIDADIPQKDIPSRSYYENDGTTYDWYLVHDGGHPVLSDILSSAFNKILFSKLKLINDIDSYRVYGILLAASLTGLVFWWANKVYGRIAGVVAALSLFLYPLFWSESHFNTQKDVPETVFWSFMLFAVWWGIVKKSVKWILVSGLLFGLALGTKFNILFSVFVIVPWLVFVVRKDFFKNVKLIIASLLAPVIGVVMFIASWPYLWPDIYSRILNVVSYYKSIGLASNIDTRFLGPFGFNTYPTQWIFYTTPIIILILFILGFVLALFRIKSEKDKVSLLFLLWFIVPIFRVSLPESNIYGGIRQIMEYVPAMAILAGLGGNYLYLLILRFLKRLKFGNKYGKFISVLLVLVCFIPLIVKLIQIHPNENAYFNALIGGLAGAEARNIPSWGNTFGAAYRQGVKWINAHAEKGANIVLNNGLMPDIPAIWFRQDLNFSNSLRSGYLQKGEYAIGLTYQGTSERSYYDSYLEKFLEPVYQAKVDGVAVLKVWKNDGLHLKSSWKENLYSSVTFSKEDFGIRFTLVNPQNISRLEANYWEFNCDALKSAFVRISEDAKTWTKLQGTFPREALVPVLGAQPKNGMFIEPFVGQKVKYIDLVYSPQNACLGELKNYKLYIFDGGGI